MFKCSLEKASADIKPFACHPSAFLRFGGNGKATEEKMEKKKWRCHRNEKASSWCAGIEILLSAAAATSSRLPLMCAGEPDAENPKRRRKRKQDGENHEAASKVKKRRLSPSLDCEVSVQ